MAWKRSRYERSTGRVTWRIEWREGGKKRSRALGPVTEAEADAELARVERGERPITLRLSPPDALERFIHHLEAQRRSRNTIAFYREHLGRLFDAMPDMPMTSWRRTHLETYLASKRDDWSARTVGIVVNAARRFLRWADEAGVEHYDFVGTFRAPKVRRRHEEAMSPGQVRSLLDAVRGTPLAAPVALAAYGGLSRGDIRTITWAEVDLKSGWIRRPRDKTGVTLAIPIVEPLSAALRALPHRSGLVCLGLPKSDSSLHKALHLACDRAGVPRGGWHRLRHFVATAAATAGWDVATVGRLLGHRPGSAVTLGYMHSDEDRLRGAAEAVAEWISKDSASAFDPDVRST